MLFYVGSLRQVKAKKAATGNLYLVKRCSGSDFEVPFALLLTLHASRLTLHGFFPLHVARFTSADFDVAVLLFRGIMTNNSCIRKGLPAMEQSEIEKIILRMKDPGSFGESLGEFRQLSKEDKLRLLGALKAVRDESVGIYLNALYEGEKDKDVQKQMRKLLFGLKTVGIKVEQPKESGEAVLKKVEEVRGQRALLSNYDFQGTRLIVAAYEIKKNAFVFINASTHFSEGLVELMTGPIDRTGLEEILKEFLSGRTPNMTVAEISPAYAGYLLDEASARSGKNKDDIRQLKKLIGPVKGTVQKPRDIYSLPIPEDTRPLPMERVLELPLFEAFGVTWKTVEEDRKTYNSTAGSAIVLPPHMLQEKKQSFLKELLEKEEVKSQIPLIGRLLEDYACIFHGLKQFAHYKGLIDYLADESAPKKSMEYFIRKSLAKSEEKQSGLLVNPYG
jgi:hypothetical protein